MRDIQFGHSGTLSRQDGKWPAFAWPGGYQIIYYAGDYETLCPDCANGENGSLASEESKDREWRIVGADIFWEGPEQYCAHCNCAIESEYGNPGDSEDSDNA